MSKTSCLAGLASTAALFAATAALAAVPLRGQVVRVGYAGSGSDEQQQGSDHFRVGCFTPILVELANDGGDTFTGVIEARQKDRDGDEVVARREVMVNGTRRFYLYVPTGESDAPESFSIRVLDTDGALVTVQDEQNRAVRELLPAARPVRIAGDTRVILDISGVSRLRSSLVSSKRLNRPVVVLRVAASNLPEDPVGLEMADTVVWDQAGGEDMDVPQRESLLEWVRRGGHLLIGVSRNWEQLSKSKFGEFLPAKLSGTANAPEMDPAWADDLSSGGMVGAFSVPLSYCPVTRAALWPDSIPIIPKDPETETPLLAVYRPLGRGHIVLVTAELREMLDPRRLDGAAGDTLLRRVVGLRDEGPPQSQENIPHMRADLFRFVEQRTGFQVTTQLYLLFAFVFVVAYVGIATGGSWMWLKRRKLSHHAWTAFAAVVLVAGVTSLGAVHLIRGVGHRVQELTLVDGQAGSSEAAAVCYFGLKTAVHTNLDLHLATRGRSVEETPENTTVIKPLPDNPDLLGLSANRYQAAQRYEAAAGAGELRNVPLRATLKQFQGFWRGQMPGRLDAQLKRKGAGMDPSSWLQNGLGTDLKDCYLLVPANNAGWPDRGSILAIRCYRVSALAKNQRLVLGQIQDVIDEADPSKTSQRLHLSEADDLWLRPFGARTQNMYRVDRDEEDKIDMGQLNNALMALSIFDEIGREERVQVTRSEGQQLDRSLAMSRGTALLIGFSDDPGPAWLCYRPPGDPRARWRPLPSEDDRRVMYRITIPIAE